MLLGYSCRISQNQVAWPVAPPADLVLGFTCAKSRLFVSIHRPQEFSPAPSANTCSFLGLTASCGAAALSPERYAYVQPKQDMDAYLWRVAQKRLELALSEQ
jgi:hypothetical protein